MRPATPAEVEDTRAFFDELDRGLAGRVLGGHRLAVVERDGIPFVCLVTPDVLDQLPGALHAGAHAAGLPIGILQDGAFHLDLQGAVLAARHTKSGTVRVSEHAARLFLYGRGTLGDSILWADRDLREGDPCIVTDPRGDAMGIGVVVGSFKGHREAVRAVHDLGTYLRDQDEGE